MANYDPTIIFEDFSGRLEKHSNITMRRKKWRYSDGRIFGYGPKEVYGQNDRDYKRSPRTPAEQVQHGKWTEACREASRITHDPSHPRYAEMLARHQAQLRGKPDSVIKPKRICRFLNFVTSILLHE